MYRTVLCLYDSEETLRNLEKSVGTDFHVIGATTVFSALQQLRKCHPDLIVVQLHLKDESCFDFLKVAQSSIKEKKIPTVAVSVMEACDDAIESYLKRVCQYFGCGLYMPCADFRSHALRFTLNQLVRKSAMPIANKVC